MSDDRLSKQDWVDAGLVGLAQSGVNALKADTLAKALGVSRGSFYWHFTNVSEFQIAVLTAWEKRSTEDVIALVERETGDPVARLHRLTRHVFAGDGALERQVRAWASQDKVAAVIQDQVDRRRIGYVTKLFVSAGLGRGIAKARARFVYLALIGQFSTGRYLALDQNDLAKMVELMLRTE